MIRFPSGYSFVFFVFCLCSSFDWFDLGVSFVFEFAGVGQQIWYISNRGVSIIRESLRGERRSKISDDGSASTVQSPVSSWVRNISYRIMHRR